MDLVEPDARVADLTSTLAVPSITGSDAESELQHLLQRRLRRDGMDNQRADVGEPGHRVRRRPDVLATGAGRSVNASARTSGVDATAKFMLVNAALLELERRRNRNVHPLMRRYDIAYPLSIGTIRAGDWASTMPDLLIAEGRLGARRGRGASPA